MNVTGIERSRLSPRKHNAIIMLVFSIAFVIGARFILSDPQSGEPLHLKIPVVGELVTPSCPSKIVTGVPCPVCGITHSIAYISHGRLIKGFRYHPLGPLFALSMLLAIPWSIGILLSPDTEPSPENKEIARIKHRRLMISIGVLIMASWAISLARYYDLVNW